MALHVHGTVYFTHFFPTDFLKLFGLENGSQFLMARLRFKRVRLRCLPLCSPFVGELFAQCPVDAFPGLAVEPVSDSSRYFVLRLEDNTGKECVKVCVCVKMCVCV